MIDFSKEILRENILYACKQFNRFANLSPMDRNKYLIEIFTEMLSESEKYQIKLTIFEI